jgi:hypothetical protein
MIHLGCEKGLERPFSLFCHFRAAQAFELGKLPPDRWHRQRGSIPRSLPTFQAGDSLGDSWA